MSTVLIIAIVLVVLVLIALVWRRGMAGRRREEAAGLTDSFDRASRRGSAHASPPATASGARSASSR